APPWCEAAPPAQMRGAPAKTASRLRGRPSTVGGRGRGGTIGPAGLGRIGPAPGLFHDELPRVGAALADGEGDRLPASRASAGVARAVARAVDPLVDAAAVEEDAKPGARSGLPRRRLLRLPCREVGDLQLVIARIVGHGSSTRSEESARMLWRPKSAAPGGSPRAAFDLRQRRAEQVEAAG